MTSVISMRIKYTGYKRFTDARAVIPDRNILCKSGCLDWSGGSSDRHIEWTTYDEKQTKNMSERGIGNVLSTTEHSVHPSHPHSTQLACSNSKRTNYVHRHLAFGKDTYSTGIWKSLATFQSHNATRHTKLIWEWERAFERRTPTVLWYVTSCIVYIVCMCSVTIAACNTVYIIPHSTHSHTPTHDAYFLCWQMYKSRPAGETYVLVNCSELIIMSYSIAWRWNVGRWMLEIQCRVLTQFDQIRIGSKVLNSYSFPPKCLSSFLCFAYSSRRISCNKNDRLLFKLMEKRGYRKVKEIILF